MTHTDIIIIIIIIIIIVIIIVINMHGTYLGAEAMSLTRVVGRPSDAGGPRGALSRIFRRSHDTCRIPRTTNDALCEVWHGLNEGGERPAVIRLASLVDPTLQYVLVHSMLIKVT